MRGFFDTLPPMPGAIDFWNNWQNTCDLYFLTRPSLLNRHSYSEKANWVYKHLGQNALEKLILSPRKDLLYGDILIDDYGGNGQSLVKGEWWQFGTDGYPSWEACDKLLSSRMELTKIISADMKQNTKSELVGANNDSIVLDASGTRTSVRFDSKGWDNVTKSLNKLLLTENLKEITSNDIPDEIYLQLEGVKGKEDSIICTVSVNHQYVGHISLFGLHNATSKDGTHGGGGLTIKLDITKVVDKMQINNLMDVNSLDILIQPVNMITKGNELTIERISIYRKTQQ